MFVLWVPKMVDNVGAAAFTAFGFLLSARPRSVILIASMIIDRHHHHSLRTMRVALAVSAVLPLMLIVHNQPRWFVMHVHDVSEVLGVVVCC